MSALADAHIEAQRRLRALTTAQVERIWRALPAYDEDQVPVFTSTAGGVVLAAQRQSVALTTAFLARALGGAAPRADIDAIVTGTRGGASVDDVYRRPFVTVWTALAGGTPWEQAVQAGMARATGTAAMDVQVAMRDTLTAVGDADDRIVGYQRVADPGACDFCQEVDGARLRSATPMPLHNHCGCGVDVLTDDFTPDPVPAGVAVHEHGELGPVLGAPDHDFTQL